MLAASLERGVSLNVQSVLLQSAGSASGLPAKPGQNLISGKREVLSRSKKRARRRFLARFAKGKRRCERDVCRWLFF
jgi:hypothetical protein